MLDLNGAVVFLMQDFLQQGFHPMVDSYETNVRLKRDRWVSNVELLTTRVPADVGLVWDKC
jgi:hypothetical protein